MSKKWDWFHLILKDIHRKRCQYSQLERKTKVNAIYLHEYGYYHQSIGAFSSFCVVCVQLMIVVDQLDLESESERHLLLFIPLYWKNVGVILLKHLKHMPPDYKICLKLISKEHVIVPSIIYHFTEKRQILVIMIMIYAFFSLEVKWFFFLKRTLAFGAILT